MRLQTKESRKQRNWPFWALLALVMLFVAVGGLALWVDTRAGHRALARNLSGSQVAPGITVEVETISGSVWNSVYLENVTFSDADGAFLTVPLVDLSWEPDFLITGDLFINAVLVSEARLDRLPRISAGAGPDGGYGWIETILIRRAELRHIEFPPTPDGKRRYGSASGFLVKVDDVFTAKLEFEQIGISGGGKGDRLELIVRQSSGDGGLGLTGSLAAERDGVLASLAGVPAPLRFKFVGTPGLGPLETAAGQMGLANPTASRRP